MKQMMDCLQKFSALQQADYRLSHHVLSVFFPFAYYTSIQFQSSYHYLIRFKSVFDYFSGASVKQANMCQSCLAIDADNFFDGPVH